MPALGQIPELVDLFDDARTLLLPLTPADIRAALTELRCWPLLRGYRGKPAADIDALTDTISKIAGYAVDNSTRLLELDVNPLMVTADGAVAADVLIVEVDN